MADVHSLDAKRSAAQSAEKRAKFVDLAEKRTINAIKAIRVIGKLGNKSHYVYDEGDVKKIVSTLTREIEALKGRMLSKGARDSVEFKL
jgi:hypothetical protein